MQANDASGTTVRPDEAASPSGALLAISIAADTTSVVLIDRVEAAFRFIARAEQPSTHRPPTGDARPAIFAALGELERVTGRRLLDGENVLMPQRRDGSGVDAVVAASSDLAPLDAVILAAERSHGARSALAALRELPVSVQETVDPHQAALEQRIAALAKRPDGPDLLLLVDPSPAIATRVTAALAAVDGKRPAMIICAPGDAQRDTVEGVEVDSLPALSTTAGMATLRAALRRRLRERLLQHVPGLRALDTLAVDAVGSADEDQGLTLRFLARQHARSLVYVAVDGSATLALAAANDGYAGAVDAQVGLRAGAPEVLRRRGVDAIAGWLPDEPAPLHAALRNRIMNRYLRPRLPSTDVDDLLLDAALGREALLDLLPALGKRRPLPDTLIGGGALARCPLPALVALWLLDLLPAAQGIVDLTLDRDMLAIAGALARIDPTAAASLAGTGEPLATAVLLGPAPPLVKAANIELTAQGEQAVTAEVRRGELVRLPLARGKRAQLRVRINGLAVGAKGIELRRDISGSTLGVVVDARAGRHALTAASKRGAAMQRWLAALDPAAPALTHRVEENQAR